MSFMVDKRRDDNHAKEEYMALQELVFNFFPEFI